jgi:integrase
MVLDIEEVSRLDVAVAFGIASCGLPWIRLHGLRHTMASLALRNGVDIATVSERLGHADTNITARIYLHGSKESDRAAADLLDAALFQ